ncbi:hypothetical protein FIBSPDRAFT_695448, partial [Athelia psychrophila]
DLPDVRTHTKQWIAETDKICKDRFNPLKPLPFDHDRGQTEDYFLGNLNENVVQEIVQTRRFACSTRHRLSENATRLFSKHDFDEAWPALGDREREKHLLAAVKEQEGQRNSADFQLRGPTKLDCPELYWEELVKDKGRGFLNLLMSLMLDNNDDPPKQPLVLEQPRFDEIIGWSDQAGPGQRACLDFRRVIRTRHIETYCSLVLAEYCGKKVQYQSLAHEHSKTKETLAAAKPMISFFTAGDSEQTKRWMKDEVARRKQMKLFCEHCLKVEDKKDGKMSVCQPCKRIGREVRYCGKDCQKSAWKFHKRDCGKKFGASPPFVTTWFLFSWFLRFLFRRGGLPFPGSGPRRPSSFLSPIRFLDGFSKKVGLSVLLTVRRLVRFSLVRLGGLYGAILFAIMRNRSMFNADESALFYMYRVFQRWETAEDAKHQYLRKQLRKEYGIPFENVMNALDNGIFPAPPTVSTEELDAMLTVFKKTGRFSEELRDYVPGAKGKKTVPRGIQVGPKKDLTVMLEWPED